jgi:hypothetical protein
VKAAQGTRLWEGFIWLERTPFGGTHTKLCAYVHEGSPGHGASVMRSGKPGVMNVADEQFPTLEEALNAADALLAARDAAYRLSAGQPSPSPP